MSIYGKVTCIYHKYVPNPYYLVICGNPKEEGIKEAKDCNKCRSYKFKEVVENESNSD